MSRTLRERLAALELGELGRVVELRTEARLPSGREAKARLVQTDRGAWILLSADDPDEQLLVDLSEPPPALRSGPLGDRIRAGGRRFLLPAGARKDGRAALAEGRLRAALRARDAEPGPEAPLRSEAPAGLALALRSLAAPGETPLACLDTGRREACDEALDPEPVHVLLTDRRAREVAVGGLGSLRVREVDGSRAEAARALLQPGGLRAGSGEGRGARRAVNKDRLLALLPDPDAAPTASARAVAWIARPSGPDPGAIRNWCERLAEQSSPALLDAVARAALVLGTDVPAVYLSRGERGVGARSMGGRPPLLVVGGEHLSPGSPHALSDAELAFAAGAELAHLRFGHRRFTDEDLWGGAWAKTAQLLALIPAAGPLLSRVPGLQGVTGKAVRGVAGTEAFRASLSLADRARRTVTGWVRGGERAPGEGPRPGGPGSGASGAGIAPDNAELHRTVRAMQRTADRAGLLICGDLRAAIRAMFLMSPRLAPELAAAERLGLAAALGRKPDDEALADLRDRVASLLGWSLSGALDELLGP